MELWRQPSQAGTRTRTNSPSSQSTSYLQKKLFLSKRVSGTFWSSSFPSNCSCIEPSGSHTDIQPSGNPLQSLVLPAHRENCRTAWGVWFQAARVTGQLRASVSHSRLGAHGPRWQIQKLTRDTCCGPLGFLSMSRSFEGAVRNPGPRPSLLSSSFSSLSPSRVTSSLSALRPGPATSTPPGTSQRGS